MPIRVKSLIPGLLAWTIGAAGAVHPASLGPCDPLPAELGRQVSLGWTAYRQNQLGPAAAAFRQVLAACPSELSSLNGMGYVLMRQGDTAQARTHFEKVVGIRDSDYDARTGLGLLAYRSGRLDGARRQFEAVLRAAPNDSQAKWFLSRLPRDLADEQLPALVRPAAVAMPAKTVPRGFAIRTARGGWEPLWLKGVNLGAALPGKHPSEFPPDDGTYEEWIRLTAELGANVLRVYTIHPPHFYRALADWNRTHPDSVVWLIHGVWTELPPGELEDQYDDTAWKEDFRGEMRRVVDLLHGQAKLPHRPGHASGVYRSDVSPWVLAYIIGREWEPYSIIKYVDDHPSVTSYRGRYFDVPDGNAAEVWLAEQCDYLVGYEMDRFNAQRPIAYTNWPTLDPLEHITEATSKEEDRLRKARGERLAETSREFDNDAVGLDATHMRATAAFPAGVFASFHAYPYYPDFMVVDPEYAKARSPDGPSNYFGYLTELVRHHGSMPVVISEYGVPSSRGNAHFQPQGWNHGGHSEADQAAIDARLTRDIHASGAAGAVLFALIDEWFKKNWIVIDFEQPLERNRLWLNPLDAEQNYGIIAMRPGQRERRIVIDGDRSDWKGREPWYTVAGADSLGVRRLTVDHDEAYVYLLLETGGRIDWSRRRYLIGIDTYDDRRGDFRLPFTKSTVPVGLEFAVDLSGPTTGQLLVDQPYTLYRSAPIEGANPPASMQVYNRPFRTEPNADGRYDTLLVETNRRRIGRDGVVYPAFTYHRNQLLFARQEENSLADWYADPNTGVIEIRIPWGMLQVLDPSSHQVLQGHSASSHDPEGATTDGFRFVVQSYDPSDPSKATALVPTTDQVPLWTWPGWEEPHWYAEKKPLFNAMRDLFTRLPKATP